MEGSVTKIEGDIDTTLTPRERDTVQYEARQRKGNPLAL
jgi:anti-anti-sigma regulatory factor